MTLYILKDPTCILFTENVGSFCPYAENNSFNLILGCFIHSFEVSENLALILNLIVDALFSDPTISASCLFILIDPDVRCRGLKLSLDLIIWEGGWASLPDAGFRNSINY